MSKKHENNLYFKSNCSSRSLFTWS